MRGGLKEPMRGVQHENPALVYHLDFKRRTTNFTYITKQQIRSSEVMRPLRDAVRLVDAHERDWRKIFHKISPQNSAFPADHSFGGYQQDGNFIIAKFFHNFFSLLGGLICVETGGVQKARKIQNLKKQRNYFK